MTTSEDKNLTESSQRILLVEDDSAIALGLSDALEFEGFRVVHADTAAKALEKFSSTHPDCVILDLMLPDQNGYQLCREFRKKDVRIPILMLTARSQESDKIRGLEVGADDYVTKPFSLGELVARIRALLRRVSRASKHHLQENFKVGDAVINPAAHTLQRNGELIELSFYEVELLKLLYDQAGQPVSRDEILERIWGITPSPTNRTVDNFVVKLRRKIEEKPDRPRHIITVYAVGYKLVP